MKTASIVVLVLAGLFAAFVVAFMFLIHYATMQQWTYWQYGCWGMSPARLVKKATNSQDLEEVIACVDALSAIDQHYQKQTSHLPDAVICLFDLYDNAPDIWGDLKPPSKVNYLGFSSTAPDTDRFDVLVRAAILHFIMVHFQFWPPPIQEDVRIFFDRIKPNENSPLYEEWKFYTDSPFYLGSDP